MPDAWVVVNLPGDATTPGSALAATAPTAQRAMFFAAGADKKVYGLDWPASADTMPVLAWSEVAPGSVGVVARSAAGVAAVSRVNGQVELYAQSGDGVLNKAWPD